MSEICTYSEAELMNPENASPPGWRQPGNLPSILKTVGQRDGWTPALSLSVFRGHPERPGEVQTLTGIRGASTTHKGVLSTLTGQFPAEILPLLVKKKQRYVVSEYPIVSIGEHGPNPQEMAIIARYAPNLDGTPDPSNLLAYLCHDILTRKLGRPDLVSMKSDDELGTVSLASMALGLSYVGDRHGQARYERLLMVGLAFMLHPHQSHVFDHDLHDKMSTLPPGQQRYTSLGWTDNMDSFPAAVQTKNVLQLAPYVSEGEAVAVCARGQCLAMTSELISRHDLLGHLGRMALEDIDYAGQPIGDPFMLRSSRRR